MNNNNNKTKEYHNPYYNIKSLTEEQKKYHKQRTKKQLNIQLHSNNYFYDENKELRENAPASEKDWIDYINNLIEDFIDNNKDDENGLEYIHYICHDKDKDKDGKIKPPHFYICLKFKKAKTIGKIAKELEVANIKNIQIAHDVGDSIQHLTHISIPAIIKKEIIYTDSDVKSYDFSEKENCGLYDLRAKINTKINNEINDKTLRKHTTSLRKRVIKVIHEKFEDIEQGNIISEHDFREAVLEKLYENEELDKGERFKAFQILIEQRRYYKQLLKDIEHKRRIEQRLKDFELSDFKE